jgi:hypothetical protein
MTGLGNGLDGNLIGTVGSPINPHLSALADNGGPTQTVALRAGSPASDILTSTGKRTPDRETR